MNDLNNIKFTYKDQEFVLLKRPLGQNNFDKIAVIEEKSNSSLDSDSSVDISLNDSEVEDSCDDVV